MEPSSGAIAANLARVRERIASACARAGRRPEDVTLVAVSKTFPLEAIRAAHAAGVRHFGENRVQEWETKQPLLAGLLATWHLVGHLQSNKARRAAALFHSIDSVDSLALAQRLDRAFAEWCAGRNSSPQSQEAGAVRLPVLLEVRLAPEESKSGVELAELGRVAEGVVALDHLDLRGLMCIPPDCQNPADARPFFRCLRELRDALQTSLSRPFPDLSMGMSHDFEVAVEEGATAVRLGTAVFGARA